ncbi:hypothetical protein NBT05_02500 [Aquimarina sp. ERC-38]|uniref:hypothetical protein n=1 Tax=Aquimarina sp. ERC-38 TaxID=2949996 RepID=UPI0022479556|nr:hypothetical protein [Aquimarina sp. ERC-38]UZO81352.1 hypothetical protein NBT05_02500 [Aquimarina sp. ERC-38]
MKLILSIFKTLFLLLSIGIITSCETSEDLQEETEIIYDFEQDVQLIGKNEIEDPGTRGR